MEIGKSEYRRHDRKKTFLFLACPGAEPKLAL